MGGIFNKKPVAEGNVDISDRRCPKSGNKYRNIHKNYWEEMEDDMKDCGVSDEGMSFMNELKECRDKLGPI